MAIIIIIFLAMVWIVTGVMAAWTGAGGGKCWRREIMPGITTLIGIIGFFNLWMVTMMARAGILSLGYGIPDPPTQPNPDKGSVIGRFWLKILKDYKKAGIATRGTVGFMEGLALLSIPIITGDWILWILATLLIMGNSIVFSQIITNQGELKIWGKKLLWQEILIHGNDSVIITLLVILCR